MRIIISIIILTILTVCSGSKSETSISPSDTMDSVLYRLDNIFVGDSGYIMKDNSLAILKYIASRDTMILIEPQSPEYLSWDSIAPTDTMGIYYKDECKNCYHAYIDNIAYFYDTSLIIEVDIDNRTIEHEEFHGAMYKCCWNGRFDGFRKIGKYYYVKVCGTGSAYCAGDFYLFEDFSNIGNTICESAFSGIMPIEIEEGVSNIGYGILYSSLNLTNDGIQMHYTLDEGLHIEINDTTTIEKELRSTRFDVDYIFSDGEWRAKDSTMLKTIDLPL